MIKCLQRILFYAAEKYHRNQFELLIFSYNIIYESFFIQLPPLSRYFSI